TSASAIPSGPKNRNVHQKNDQRRSLGATAAATTARMVQTSTDTARMRRGTVAHNRSTSDSLIEHLLNRSHRELCSQHEAPFRGVHRDQLLGSLQVAHRLGQVIGPRLRTAP